jgi:hypothetical protein
MTISLTPESAKEFADARRQAFIEGWFNFFTGRPNDLLSFEEVRQNLRLQDSAYKGLQEVEVDKIVGSVGRYRDFTRSFLPKSDQSSERWRRVDAVVHDYGFPPIDVYKVGDVYFVRDGNHRVSIARTHKAETIEAYVIEYKTPVAIDKDDDLDDLLLKIERIEFFEQTHLDQIRPDHNIVFTEPGRYRLAKEHIAFHKYLKETEAHAEISYENAVDSWYDNVYTPVIEHIRQSEVLKNFPGRTEADLYAWLLSHRAKFDKELKALGYVSTEALIEELKRERATNPFARLMGYFRNQLDLQGLSLRIERDKFLRATHLDEIRPDHNIKFTESGCYKVTKHHIAVHKYLKETKASCEISYAEAVASWYDNVYGPLIQSVRDHNLLKQFPENTEADLYLWLTSRREETSQENHDLGPVLDEEIIKELERKNQFKPIMRLTNFFSQKLDLQSIIDH